MINARDYNAVGNRRTDDTVAIQDAIDSNDHSTAVGRLMSGGHGDPAARRSLLDQPDIDLPCPFFMILLDLLV
jgi:hypothetical protein